MTRPNPARTGPTLERTAGIESSGAHFVDFSPKMSPTNLHAARRCLELDSSERGIPSPRRSPSYGNRPPSLSAIEETLPHPDDVERAP